MHLLVEHVAHHGQTSKQDAIMHVKMYAHHKEVIT